MKIISQTRLEQILQVLKSKMSSFATKKDTVLETSLSMGRRGDIGGGSFAFGNSVKASGSCAFAIGRSAEAEGAYTFAAGLATNAGSDYQNVFGKCNVIDTSDEYAEIVGNGEIYSGSGVIVSSRSNARALDWSGNERLAGSVYVNCNYDSTGGNRLLDESEIMAEHDLHVIMNTIWDFPYISSWTPEDARTTHTAVTANITGAKVGSLYKIQAVRDDEETSTVEMDEPAESTSITMTLFDGVPNPNGYKYTLTLYEVGNAEVLDVVVIPGNPFYD